jgi:hypothetical protein
MTKFLSTLHEDDLLTFEVSDEALETAGGNEITHSAPVLACLFARRDSTKPIKSKNWR